MRQQPAEIDGSDELRRRFSLQPEADTLLSSEDRNLARGASFRVRSLDGQVYKLRRLPSVESAERVAHLQQILIERAQPPADGRPHIELPPVVATSGRYLLTQWISGQPGPVPEQSLGNLMARIHNCRLEADELEVLQTGSPASEEAFDRRLASLRQSSLLDDEQVRAARRLFDDFRDEEPEIGIVHRDLCSDNVVLDRQAQAWLIDNETLSVAPLHHDLGRTWTHQRRSPSGWRLFFVGYAESRDLGRYRSHFPFWAVTACVESAAFRAQHWPARVARPVARLESLLAASDPSEVLWS